MGSQNHIGVGSQITIQYTNAQGRVSRRRIDVRAVTVSGAHTYIRAWCHTRGEERTFRADRMVTLASVPGTASVPAGSGHPAASVPASSVPAHPSVPAGSGHPAASVPASSASVPTGSAKAEPAPAGFYRMLALVWSVPLLFFAFLIHIEMFAPADTASRARERTAVHTVDRTAPDPIPDPPEPVPPDPPPEPTAADRRSVAFTSDTGIDDHILARVYEQADTNGDGTLSFPEIRSFQRWVYREFRYEVNHFALRPDRFGAAGGGDCEDFSLYTCGLLTYWGYDCFIAVYASPGDTYGANSHAVALLRVTGPVPGSVIVHTDADPRYAPAARHGTFIPIDYDVVGGFTNATPNPRVLIAIHKGKHIYGTRM